MIKEMAKYFKDNNERDYVLFALSLYSGLRITDILNLRVKDIKNKNEIILVEKKTKKRKTLTINPHLKNILKQFIKDKDNNDYLISARDSGDKPLSRIRAYQIIQEIGEKFNIRISPHSLRKTFGYFHYTQNKDIILLQKILNHAHPDVTYRYIGANSETMKHSMDVLKFW